MTAIIGVDPGNNGALCVLDPENARMRIFDMPVFEFTTTRQRVKIDPYGVAEIVKGQPVAACYMEEVNTSPQMGVVSAGSFMEGKGILLGVFGAMGIPLTQIKPMVWKKQLRVPADKRAAVQRASQLFPDLSSFFKGPRGGVLDGRAEAALLTFFGALELSRTPTAPVQLWE